MRLHAHIVNVVIPLPEKAGSVGVHTVYTESWLTGLPIWDEAIDAALSTDAFYLLLLLCI